MTLLTQERWTGANGAAWPAQWTATNGTATIENNRGRITLPVATSMIMASRTLNGINATDIDLCVTCYATWDGDMPNIILIINGQGSGFFPDDPDTGYALEILGNDFGNYPQAALDKWTGGGTSTQLFSSVGASNPLVPWTNGFRVRFQRTGSVLRVKIWSPNAVEPTAWLASATDPTPLGSGYVRIQARDFGGTAPRAYDFDDLVITNDGSTPTDAYGTLILSHGPTAWHRLDGSANDFFSGNAGTLTNGAAYGSRLLPANPAGQSVNLDGTNDFVSIVDHAGQKSTANFSIEAWVNADVWKAGWQSIVTKASGSYSLQVNNDQIQFRMSDGGNLRGMFGPNLAAQTTYHIVGVREGTTQRLYVNGVQVASQTITSGASDAAAGPLRIGSWDGVNEFLDGRVDEVAFYQRALTPAEIAEHYDVGARPGLSLWNGTTEVALTLSGIWNSTKVMQVASIDVKLSQGALVKGSWYSDTAATYSTTASSGPTGLATAKGESLLSDHGWGCYLAANPGMRILSGKTVTVTWWMRAGGPAIGAVHIFEACNDEASAYVTPQAAGALRIPTATWQKFEHTFTAQMDWVPGTHRFRAPINTAVGGWVEWSDVKVFHR